MIRRSVAPRSLSGPRAIVAGLVLALALPVTGRDINLDEIYLKESSPYITRLILEKIDVYLSAGARFVDRNVIFSGWMSGDALAYVKEIPKLVENQVWVYRISSARKDLIGRVKGDIMHARVSPSGRFIALWRFISRGEVLPKSEIVLVSLPGGEQTVLPASGSVLDFTFAPEGNSILRESKQGIEEYIVTGSISRLVLDRSRYAGVSAGSSPVLAYPSMDRSRWLVLSGGGGNYKTLLLEGKSQKEISGITSSTEISWMGNTAFAYRKGAGGAYAVYTQRISDGSGKHVGGDSLNTSINYSPGTGILSWLRDGLINLYYPSSNRHVSTGLEGDDVNFDGTGSRFTAQLGKRLFLVNMGDLRNRSIEVRRSVAKVLSIYEDLMGRKVEFDNDYSSTYIDRKIKLYREVGR